MVWWTGKERTLRSQDQLPQRTESDLNLHWMEKDLLQPTQPTQGSRKAINKRTWLDPSIGIIIPKDSSKKCFPILEALVEWWHKAKVWTQASSSRLEVTHLASPNGSKAQAGKTDKINRWHRCSIKCNLPHKETSREKVPTIQRIIDKINLLNKEIILFV